MVPKIGVHRLGPSPPNTEPQNGWRRLAFEAAIAALATWFAIVGITALPAIHPGQVRVNDVPFHGVTTYDFAAFYTAGTLLRQGHGSSTYDLDKLRSAESITFGLPWDKFQFLPFYNPPHAMLLFAPLSLLPLQAAAGVWFYGTVLLAIVGLWLLLRAYPARMDILPAACLLLALASSLPVYWATLMGQMSFLLLFGLCLLFVSMQSRRATFSIAGLLILSLKPQLLLLPVVLFLVQRRYRELLIAAAGGLVLTAAALALSGPHALVDYIGILAQSTSWNGENGITQGGMFGWVGMMSGLTGDQAFPGQRLVLLTLDIITLGIVTWAIVRGSRTGRNSGTLLSLAVVGGLLASPHFYAQDLLLLLPVLWLIYARDERGRLVAAYYGLAGWFIGYFHFKILEATRVNLTTIYLLGLLCLVAAGPGRSFWLSKRHGRPGVRPLSTERSVPSTGG